MYLAATVMPWKITEYMTAGDLDEGEDRTALDQQFLFEKLDAPVEEALIIVFMYEKTSWASNLWKSRTRLANSPFLAIVGQENS